LLAATIVRSCSSPWSFKRPEYTSRSIRVACSCLPSISYVLARLPCVTSKSYGFGLDGRCVPEEHKEPDIPDDFCERNSGLIFFGDAARSKEMTRNWLEEMRNRPTSDGHDQGPLRRVLWRRRDVLYDLAPNVQCRRCTKRYGVDPCDYLAWHSHRPKRLQVFTNRTLACGFRDDRLARR